MPDSVFLWDGEESLTQNSSSMQGSDLRSKLRRKEFSNIEVAHIAAVGASATCARGLGRRVIAFQDVLSAAFNHKSKLIALEAIKPLNSELYPEMGFQNTTSSFYPIEDSAVLVPMFKKIGNPIISEQISSLKKPISIETSFRNAPRKCPIAAEKLQSVAPLMHAVVSYLWSIKNDDEAKERLRQICVRAHFLRSHALKLWSMRRRCLSYNKKPHESSVLEFTDDWLRPKINILQTSKKQNVIDFYEPKTIATESKSIVGEGPEYLDI